MFKICDQVRRSRIRVKKFIYTYSSKITQMCILIRHTISECLVKIQLCILKYLKNAIKPFFLNMGHFCLKFLDDDG